MMPIALRFRTWAFFLLVMFDPVLQVRM